LAEGAVPELGSNELSRALTIVVPSYGRDGVLLDTLKHLFALNPPASEIIVVDQTDKHSPEASCALESWQSSAWMRWLRLNDPNIPGAMNRGLLEASHPIVLFLDDDIIPHRGLVEAHASALERTGAALVAGRIIQPWQVGRDFSDDDGFHFATTRPTWIQDFMGGNFSVRRDIMLRLGGFDERFVRVAYNFEAEFAHRLRRAGHRIYYEPTASIHHLKVSTGGTRTFGNHLRSHRPNHAVGAYYFILRTWSGWQSVGRFLARPLRAIATRHHLRQPWWIPTTLLAELSGMVWALVLAARGPRYLSSGKCLKDGASSA
jgi:GT2 family glycosyltransferase